MTTAASSPEDSGTACLVHINWGAPQRVLRVNREPAHWCFKCRKRLEGEWQLTEDDVEMSWYDPEWHYRCDGCHEDHMLFPGWERSE